MSLWRFIRMMIVVSTIGLTLGGSSLAESFRTPPPIYSEVFLPALTPLENALQNKGVEEDESNQDGVVLLRESLQFLDEKGGRYLVTQRIIKALTEAGAKELSEETYSYSKGREKIYLAHAQTILPDGTRIAVRPEGAILQTPQRDATDSVYYDSGELHLIYPNVKPGSIVQSIIISREDEMRIPGEFSTYLRFNGGWPIRHLRYVINLPASTAKRLKVTPLGSGVHNPKREQLEGDRVRLTWESTKIAPRPYEAYAPAIQEVGPIAFITTLPDWDTFARWYSPLLEERSQLSPELKVEIEEWTKDAKGKEEILKILHEKVANKIRYVSLAFGEADLQPYDCNTVWKNQYGDCKDKATLLRAMLRHKGIDSSVVLVETSSTGRIEKRSPDYRHFSHAIVAVFLDPKHPIFCDPTLAYGRPGLLPARSVDREGLAISDSGAKWLRIPPQSAGTSNYEFDLSLTANGELSGWMTETTTGFYGAINASDYAIRDKDSTRQRASANLRVFFKGAEVIDIVKPPPGSWDGNYTIKTYFIVPAVDQQVGTRPLLFPYASSLFHDLGTEKNRKASFIISPDSTVIRARIALPDGMDLPEVPRPLNLKSEGVDMTAGWSVKDRLCLAELKVDLKKRTITPEEFPIFFNAHLSLFTWLEQPLTLTSSNKEGMTASSSSTASSTLEHFPLMSTGDGQLTLVDHRFPESGNGALRREALFKTIQYFPTDKLTQYSARLKLAWLDHKDGRKVDVEELRDLQNKYRHDLTAETLAWGDYTLAYFLKDADSEEALKIFDRIHRSEDLTFFRRHWSAYQAVLLTEGMDRKRAIEIIRETRSSRSEAAPYLFSRFVKLLVEEGQMEAAKAEIEKVAEANPEDLVVLTEEIETIFPVPHLSKRKSVLDWISEVHKKLDDGAVLGKALSAAQERLRTINSGEEIQTKIRDHLAAHPEQKPSIDSQKLQTMGDLQRAISQAEEKGDPTKTFAYAFDLLLRFPPDESFPALYWNAIKYAEWKARSSETPDPLLPFLFNLAESLPKTSEAYWDIHLLRAGVANRNKDFEAAREIHEALLKSPSLPEGFKLVTIIRLGENLESLRRYDDALKVYGQLEAFSAFTRFDDAIFRTILLNLQMGRREEAWRLLSILRAQDEKSLSRAKAATQIRRMLALTSDVKEGTAYWDSSEQWWPAWLEVEKKLGLDEPSLPLEVPLLSDPSEFHDDLSRALTSKSPKAMAPLLRTLAHGTRWQPDLAPLLLSAASESRFMFPGASAELRSFAIALGEHYHSGVPQEQDQVTLYRVIALLDSDRHTDAAKEIRAYMEQRRDPKDSVSEAMARLWAISALRQNEEIPDAIAALEMSLKEPSHFRRALSVLLLADLYKLAGRKEDEQKLIIKEMEHPDVHSNPVDFKNLTARHAALASANPDSGKRAEVAKKWIAKFKPAWFEYAEPKSLDDPRVVDIDAILAETGSFSSDESTKVMLLLAMDPKRAGELWMNSFLSAFEKIRTNVLSREVARKMVTELLNDPDLASDDRNQVLTWAILWTITDRDLSFLDELIGLPYYQNLSENSRKQFDLSRESIVHDAASSEAISGFCTKVLLQRLSFSHFQSLDYGLQRLLARGEIQLAEQLFEKLSDINNTEIEESRVATMQLGWAKALKRAKRWEPAIKKMREIVLERYPDIPSLEPAVYDALHNPKNLYSLNEKEATKVRLYQIKNREIDLSEISFWSDFVDDLDPNGERDRLVIDLMTSAFTFVRNDSDRAQILETLFAGVDLDDPKNYEEVHQWLQPHRDPKAYPDTEGSIIANEILYQSRSNPLYTPKPRVDLPNADTERVVRYYDLLFHLSRGDLSEVQKAIDAHSMSDLLRPTMLPTTIRAFKALGMTEELALSRRSAEKASYQAILRSWVNPNPTSCRRAFRIPAALESPSLLPESWTENALEALKGERSRDMIRCYDAELRKDWERLLEASTAAIQRYPTLYYYYWFKGSALYRRVARVGDLNE